jgi:hypothetical protein
MKFLLVPILFIFKACEDYQKAKEDKLKAEQEKIKSRNKIIFGTGSIVLAAVLNFYSQLTVENFKKSKTSESNCTCQISTKISSEGWKPGSSHPKYPNVIASETKGIWDAAPGFEFVTNNDKSDLRVRPKKSFIK